MAAEIFCNPKKEKKYIIQSKRDYWGNGEKKQRKYILKQDSIKT